AIEEAEPALDEHVVRDAQRARQLVPPRGCPSELVRAHDVAVDAARPQVPARPAGVRAVQQALVVPGHGLRHRVDERAPPLASFVLVALGVADGDAGLAGEPLDGTDEIEVLDLAHERDGIATLAAAEALEEAVLLVDGERSGLLGMERTQTD